MIEKSDLLGAWHLQSWTIAYSDREDITHPFGEQPVGMIVYTADDRMSACINRRDRDLLPAELPFRRIDPPLLVGAYLTYFHYAGRYRLEDDVITHSVTQSLNPNFVGSKQRRHARLDGQTLVLSGEDVAAGVTRSHTLTWHR